MFLALLLLLLPLAVAGASMLGPSRRVLEAIASAGAVAFFVAGLWLGASVLASGPMSVFDGAIYIDALSAFEIGIAVTIGLAAQAYSRGYMGREFEDGAFPFHKLRRYYALVNLFLADFVLVCVANNLGIVWIAIEGTTLATAFLVAFYNRDASIEAAWKYFILCTVGISLALMGVILLYYSATRLPGADLDWTTLAGLAPHMDPNILKLAFVFLLVGYGTKVGLAPMHTWLPDAHSEAPSPVSALLSGILLNGAMYGLLRAHALVVRCLGEGFSNELLIAFGVISLAVAVPFILWQRDLKRLFAYSSVEHMGVIALGLGFGGPLGTFGALLHTLYHSLVKTTLFLAAGNVLLKYHTRDMNIAKGAVQTLPVTGPALLLAGLAIAGAPPFGLFLSELAILTAGFGGGHFIAASVLLVALVLVFVGIVYHLADVGLGSRPDYVLAGEAGRWTIGPIVALLVVAAGLGLYLPAPLGQAVHQVDQIVRGVS